MFVNSYLLFLCFDPPGQQLGHFCSLAALIILIVVITFVDELTEAEKEVGVFLNILKRNSAG